MSALLFDQLRVTAQESFEDGRQTGITWKETYTPGGPYSTDLDSPERHRSADADWIAYCDATLMNREAWLRGFNVGRQIAILLTMTEIGTF